MKLHVSGKLCCTAGFWTIQNFVRPFRFALAVAMAPAFDSFMNFVQNRFHCRRQTAFAGWCYDFAVTVPCFHAEQCLVDMQMWPESTMNSATALFALQCSLRCLASRPQRLYSAAFMHLRDRWPTRARRPCSDFCSKCWVTSGAGLSACNTWQPTIDCVTKQPVFER